MFNNKTKLNNELCASRLKNNKRGTIFKKWASNQVTFTIEMKTHVLTP